MFRILTYLGTGLVAALMVVGAVVYFTPAGQDALFSRAIVALLPSGEAEKINGMRVVVCGSASPLGNDPSRAQACIAVLTDDHFFLFDVGARSPIRMAQAGLPMARLSGVFLTHYHSDHIASLPDVNLQTWVQGREGPLNVYGPVGIDTVVGGFNIAYQLDRQYRTAHHGPDLLPPQNGPMNAVTIPTDDVVWTDGALTIRSFTVEHSPIEPAVGYRIDFAGRSVVISGDTNSTKSLWSAAKDADLVLHDALSRTILDQMIAGADAAQIPVMPTIMRDVIDYHADATTLEAQAKAAGVKQLAYYHLVPVPANALAERMFARGLSTNTLLVKDLHTFDLPANSTELLIHEP
ncbi:MAG: MBL fold metallo-hydrolase [Pseudomonadota bacterium]